MCLPYNPALSQILWLFTFWHWRVKHFMKQFTFWYWIQLLQETYVLEAGVASEYRVQWLNRSPSKSWHYLFCVPQIGFIFIGSHKPCTAEKWLQKGKSESSKGHCPTPSPPLLQSLQLAPPPHLLRFCLYKVCQVSEMPEFRQKLFVPTPNVNSEELCLSETNLVFKQMELEIHYAPETLRLFTFSQFGLV